MFYLFPELLPTQTLFFTLIVVQLLSHIWLSVAPMDCSTPNFPVLHHLPRSLFKLIFIESVMLSNYLIFCLSLLLLPQPFPASGCFPMSQLSSGGQSIGASASASVLSINIQGWFPLRLTCLISLQSKGLSGVFSSTTVWKHQFFSL